VPLQAATGGNYGPRGRQVSNVLIPPLLEFSGEGEWGWSEMVIFLASDDSLDLLVLQFVTLAACCSTCSSTPQSPLRHRHATSVKAWKLLPAVDRVFEGNLDT